MTLAELISKLNELAMEVEDENEPEVFIAKGSDVYSRVLNVRLDDDSDIILEEF